MDNDGIPDKVYTLEGTDGTDENQLVYTDHFIHMKITIPYIKDAEYDFMGPDRSSDVLPPDYYLHIWLPDDTEDQHSNYISICAFVSNAYHVDYNEEAEHFSFETDAGDTCNVQVENKDGMIDFTASYEHSGNHINTWLDEDTYEELKPTLIAMAKSMTQDFTVNWGGIDDISGNTCEYSVTMPEDAEIEEIAQLLINGMMEDMKTESNTRTFTVTDYKELNYTLTEADENTWSIDGTVLVKADPGLPGSEKSEDGYASQTLSSYSYQRCIKKEGNTYTLTYIDID